MLEWIHKANTSYSGHLKENSDFFFMTQSCKLLPGCRPQSQNWETKKNYFLLLFWAILGYRETVKYWVEYRKGGHLSCYSDCFLPRSTIISKLLNRESIPISRNIFYKSSIITPDMYTAPSLCRYLYRILGSLYLSNVGVLESAVVTLLCTTRSHSSCYTALGTL